MRVKIDESIIDEYAEALDRVPPIQVVYDRQANKHWLEDGYQRLLAAKKKRKTEIRIVTREGSYLDAFKGACKANDAHGVRITNEDKQKRGKEAVKRWTEKSNSELAEITGLTDKTIAAYRSELESTSEIPRLNSTVGKDGRTRHKPKHKPSPEEQTETEELTDILMNVVSAEENKGEAANESPTREVDDDEWEDNPSLQPEPKKESLPDQTSFLDDTDKPAPSRREREVAGALSAMIDEDEDDSSTAPATNTTSPTSKPHDPTEDQDTKKWNEILRSAERVILSLRRSGVLDHLLHKWGQSGATGASKNLSLIIDELTTIKKRIDDFIKEMN